MSVSSSPFVPVRARDYQENALEPRIHITGGIPLSGELRVSGAKNAVLKLMAAALLTDQPCVIRNVPRIGDVLNMIDVLEGVGAACSLEGDVLTIEARCPVPEVPEGPARQMRASIQVMGPLLARLGEVRIGQPGGCAIGERPVDFHLAGLRAMGAHFKEGHGFLDGTASQLTGSEIYFDMPSVGATENIMMAAVLSSGETVIRNAAKEPEIVEVQNFLNCMGARVRGAGTDTIRITGVGGPLRGVDYAVIPDRIEAGTMMVAVAATRGDVRIRNVIPEHNEILISKLTQAGVGVEVSGESVRVFPREKMSALQVRSLPYPGFPTDMQPQIMALLASAEGTSIVTETVYSSRFKHVDELRRMGADIMVDGRVAVIRGKPRLSGARVEATDLRAGAALVVAGLAAEGETIVEGVRHIDRGYEDLVAKLAAAGAAVERRCEPLYEERAADQRARL